MEETTKYGKWITVGLIIVIALLFLRGFMECFAMPANEAQSTQNSDAEKKEKQKEQNIEPEQEGEQPMIALTFDDGPGIYTMQILNQLEAYGAKATFFMLGTCMSRYPAEVKRMKEIGCGIGNHTGYHYSLTKLDNQPVHDEVEWPNDLLRSIIGEGSSMMRPPYGALDERVQSLINYPIILWSVDTRDWEDKNAERVRDYVMSVVQDGDIVLMHDIHETSMQAAVELIPMLVQSGYKLVTVDELAAARGVTLENGVVYGEFRKNNE